jgi:ornithine decarboxylase
MDPDLLRRHRDDSFYVYDLKVLHGAYQEWTRAYPTIRPFYAVKCNPDRRICQTLADLGTSFDCASPAEIELIRGLGVQDDRIIFANPCKRPCDARRYGELLTTFDSESELRKMARGTRALLRIRADDPMARCNLGVKYGADANEWDGLMRLCKTMGVSLVGVSFHVGSMAKSPLAFTEGIKKARQAVDLAVAYGFDPRIIDIGGGFSDRLPESVNEALDKYFLDGYTIIAEPGRYFVEHVATLMTPVIGVKGDGVTISESLYGSFNCVVFDHAQPEIGGFYGPRGEFLVGAPKTRTIFGSTCDGADIIARDITVIDLHVGDWITWPRMGAYTSAACTNFNGIPFSDRRVEYLV